MKSPSRRLRRRGWERRASANTLVFRASVSIYAKLGVPVKSVVRPIVKCNDSVFGILFMSFLFPIGVTYFGACFYVEFFALVSYN